jgi:hypothetical protein
MGAGDDPDEYDPEEDFESRPTRLDEIPPLPEAVPEAITPRPEITGRHPTLQGYVDREVEIARARADQIEYDMMALKLAMMAAGVSHFIAEAEIDKLRRWAAVPENDRLIRASMKRA